MDGSGRRTENPGTGAVLAAVSVGGALGAVARCLAGAVPGVSETGFPWVTLLVNVSGSFLIGVLMVFATALWPQRRLTQAFLGTGFLGGYTTFSTYAADAGMLLERGDAAAGLGYLALTLFAALAAVALGSAAASLIVRSRPVGGRR
ncbi:fluoride efflux transporter CrcB [Marinactinospora endophytica]